MTEILLGVALVLLLAILALLMALLRRQAGADFTPLQPRFESLEASLEKTERTLREEMSRNREETTLNARQSREESSNRLGVFGDSLQARLAEIAGLL